MLLLEQVSTTMQHVHWEAMKHRVAHFLPGHARLHKLIRLQLIVHHSLLSNHLINQFQTTGSW